MPFRTSFSDIRWRCKQLLIFLFHFIGFSGSLLENGSNAYTTGRHASLMATSAGSNNRNPLLGGGGGGPNVNHSNCSSGESTQLREGLISGTLTGQKVNYLDSGYSEEDPNDHGGQQPSCLVKTSSGSIYIPPSKSPQSRNFEIYLLNS